MADISVLNLTGEDLNIADSYVRSLVPSSADPTTNKLATMADVGGSAGGLTFERLWRNPSPTSVFSAKAVEISNLSEYKLLYIDFRLTASDATKVNIVVPILRNNYIVEHVPSSSTIYTRNLTPLYTQTSVYFSNGNPNSSCLIPFDIYGIKH